jgi:hypothetical protein
MMGLLLLYTETLRRVNGDAERAYTNDGRKGKKGMKAGSGALLVPEKEIKNKNSDASLCFLLPYGTDSSG